LRTCQELLTILTLAKCSIPQPHHHHPLSLVWNLTYKLNVIYPSLSSSYFLNTSVILFRLIHAWTKRSKLRAFRPLLSYVWYSKVTKPWDRRYPKATRASLNSAKEIVPLWSASKRSKRERQAERKPHRPLGKRRLVDGGILVEGLGTRIHQN
jgi:hypothetical protein